MLIALIGFVFLAGWVLHFEAIVHPFSGLSTPKANAALGFVLSGLSLGLSAAKDDPQGLSYRWGLAQACAIILVLLGGLTLSQDLFRFDLGIDQGLARDNMSEGEIGSPGRMAPGSSLSFMLSGAALLTSHWVTAKRSYPAEWLCLGVRTIALTALLAYLYSVASLRPISIYSSMSPITAVLFLLLSTGTLLLNPGRGSIGLISGNYSGSVFARRLVPYMIGILVVLGWLALQGEQLRLYQPHIEVALLISLSAVILTVVVLLTARSLNNADKELRQLNADLERRVAERTTELEASKKELEDFSYTMSHDLRAPVRAVDGFSRILEEEYAASLDAEGLHFLSLVRQNAGQMGMLIDDLLAVLRLGRKAINRRKIDMNKLARETQAGLNGQANHPSVHIGELPEADGDPELIRQVLANLLSNAIKFSRDATPPRTEVGHETQSGETVYFVRDNGVGFDAQYSLKLFGMFQRLHRAEDYEGTGVGLAIVHRIVQGHGGRIWAEAEVGRGATFYFTLGREGGDKPDG